MASARKATILLLAVGTTESGLTPNIFFSVLANLDYSASRGKQ